VEKTQLAPTIGVILILPVVDIVRFPLDDLMSDVSNVIWLLLTRSAFAVSSTHMPCNPAGIGSAPCGSNAKYVGSIPPETYNLPKTITSPVYPVPV
jgi:hypothetical protein